MIFFRDRLTDIATFISPSYPAGSVVLLLLNLHTFDTTATLSNSELAASSRDVYWLTPPGNITDIESQ